MELLAARGGFDAVLLDLQLPEKDGLTLAEEIRQLPAGRAVPLLLLSSVRVRNDDARPPALGITVSVHKPIRPAQLLDALCRAMSVAVPRERKLPSAPSLDVNFANRLPLRVLLADDNPINLKVGLSVLHKLGYRAEMANHGGEVMRALEQKVYDVLFLDVQMPEMDGLECARQICQRWTRDKRPVIIAMTGNALMGDREKCLAAGMDDYISKPVRSGELQAALERWGPTKSRKFDTTYLHRPPPSPSNDVLDESILAELRDVPPADGVSIVRELVDLFLESAPGQIAKIEQSANDPKRLEFQAHALKSMSLNLGCRQLVALAQQLEDLGRAGTVQGALPLVRELETAYTRTKTHLIALRDEEPARPTPQT